MNVNEWVWCVSEAYGMTGNRFSAGTRRALLEKVSMENVYADPETRADIEGGVISAVPPGVELQGEAAETEEVMRRYFFRKATYGETFGLISRVEQFPRASIEENYQLRNGPFINLAKTYWTFKMEVCDLFPDYHDLVLAQVLTRVEGDIASVFFPTPGPVVIWVRQRRQQQRQLLERYAPEIDIEAFLKNNPILGTSKGRISRRVFKERISIRCQNPDCSRLIAVPNTVKPLRVTCRYKGCGASFRFPARDFEWLDQVRSDAHPELHKIDGLESYRQSYGIAHPIFFLWVMSSPWMTRRVQESVYKDLKKKMPQASEKELLKAVFKTRAFVGPPGPAVTEKEIDKAMESINSLEDLIDHLIKEETQEPASPDPFGIGARVDEILSAMNKEGQPNKGQ